MKKIEPIAGHISVVLAIIGFIGLFFGFGVFVAIIGIVFGCIGYGYDNSKESCIGTWLCFLCVAILCISCILDGKYIRFLRFR